MKSPTHFHRPQVLVGYGQALVIVNASVRAGIRAAAVVGAALALAVALAITQAAASQSGVRLLVLGDSLTAGYGLPQQQSFPAQLEEGLRAAGHDVTVINAGVSGDTSAGGLARLDWTLGGMPAGAPEATIIQLGGNDALRGLDPQSTFDNLSAILARFQERGIPVLLTGMLAPPNLGSEYAEAFNAIYPRLAEEHDVLFYPFFLAGVAGEPRFNQGDGIHPTAQGTSVIVQNILPSVEALLREARQDERP